MDDDPVSSYLQYLPAILREDDFLGRFLLAFEAVLSKGDASRIPDGLEHLRALRGLEELVESVHRHFDPDAGKAPPDFLPWLSQWVATSLRDDWSVETRRKFLGEIVALYRERGTRAGIEKVLKLSDEVATVIDFHEEGDEAEARRKKAEGAFGKGPMPPHFFGVILQVKARDPTQLARRARRVRAIVDREKPAHTVYALRLEYPAMSIMNESTNDEPGIIICYEVRKDDGQVEVRGTTVIGTEKVTDESPSDR